MVQLTTLQTLAQTHEGNACRPYTQPWTRPEFSDFHTISPLCNLSIMSGSLALIWCLCRPWSLRLSDACLSFPASHRYPHLGSPVYGTGAFPDCIVQSPKAPPPAPASQILRLGPFLGRHGAVWGPGRLLIFLSIDGSKFFRTSTPYLLQFNDLERNGHGLCWNVGSRTCDRVHAHTYHNSYKTR